MSELSGLVQILEEMAGPPEEIGGCKISRAGENSEASISPLAVKTATLGPEVPTSIVRKRLAVPILPHCARHHVRFDQKLATDALDLLHPGRAKGVHSRAGRGPVRAGQRHVRVRHQPR